MYMFKSHYLHGYWLNGTTNVPLLEWLWHWIIQKDWYGIKKNRNQTMSQTIKSRKQNWEEKQLYGYLKIQKKLLIWLYEQWEILKKETESLDKSTCACGVMVMDTATRVQILNETGCISRCTNTLGKGMNPLILPPATGKIVGQSRFFSLGETTSQGEGKLNLNLLNSA